MKTKERHHLKENEFASTMARVVSFANDRRDRVLTAVVIVIVLVGAVAAYYLITNRKADQAGAAFASAMAVFDAQIAPAPTVPGAKQAAGTYPTAKARDEAALKAFQDVAAAYGSTKEGLGAGYQAGAILNSLDRPAEAEKVFQDVISRAPAGSLYAGMARLGLAESLVASKQYDRAIKEYTDLSAQRDGLVPVDGVLMQLAQTYLKAGNTQDARAAFKRVVDEFPTSNYVADARTQIAAIAGL